MSSKSKRGSETKALIFDGPYPAWPGFPNQLRVHFDEAGVPRFLAIGYYHSPDEAGRTADYQSYPLGEQTDTMDAWGKTKGGRWLQLELSAEGLFTYGGYQRGAQHAAWALVKI